MLKKYLNKLDDHECDLDQVSHWMLLPEPPKEENLSNLRGFL